MKTTIFFATQTSGTGSMLRIFCKIGGYNFVNAKFIDKFLKNKTRDELRTAELPTDGKLHLFNLPPFLNKTAINPIHQFIINYRDPRDRLCNMYHWAFVHPVRGLEGEKLQKHRDEIQNKGIDSFVLKHANDVYYKNIWYILENVPQQNSIVLSYAKLCLDFDTFIEESAKFLDVEVTKELLGELEVERVENLSNNKSWIGNKWAGSDTLPGRYKRELKLETIEIINKKFEPLLRKMAKYDPSYAKIYLEGFDY